MNTTQEILDVLFPVPSAAPRDSALTPARRAGPDVQSAAALVEALQDVHKRLHIFFNDRHFHNHATHHVLAVYALGGNAAAINAAYGTQIAFQREAIPSPEPITKHNWKEHLQDEKYYQAYLAFFTVELCTKGPAAVLQDYIFSKDANFLPAEGKTERPSMYNRFMGGILHPMIHCGYGAEFGLLGMWAEGLAEACMEFPLPSVLVPDALLEGLFSTTFDLPSRIGSVALDASTAKKQASSHALSILGRIAKDPAFSREAVGITDGMTAMKNVIEKCLDKLLPLLGEWTVGTTRKELDEKMEELIWMATVIYAIGGRGDKEKSDDPAKELHGDFILMHLVTSVFFVPSLTSYLPPASAAFFLRTYFLMSLVIYIMRGRPALPLTEFFANTPTLPSPPGSHPAPSTDVCNRPIDLPAQKDNWLAAKGHKILFPNPWLPIMQSTLVHPDEHLCKINRALWHFGSVFGTTPAGMFAHLKGDLGGAEVLDGSLFVRAAILTMDRLGWVREGEAQKFWDHPNLLNFAHARR